MIFRMARRPCLIPSRHFRHVRHRDCWTIRPRATDICVWRSSSRQRPWAVQRPDRPLEPRQVRTRHGLGEGQRGRPGELIQKTSQSLYVEKRYFSKDAPWMGALRNTWNEVRASFACPDVQSWRSSDILTRGAGAGQARMTIDIRDHLHAIRGGRDLVEQVAPGVATKLAPKVPVVTHLSETSSSMSTSVGSDCWVVRQWVVRRHDYAKISKTCIEDMRTPMRLNTASGKVSASKRLNLCCDRPRRPARWSCRGARIFCRSLADAWQKDFPQSGSPGEACAHIM